MRQAAFLDGLHGFAEQKITTGVIRDGKWVAISFVAQQELTFVVGAPQSIRSKSWK